MIATFRQSEQVRDALVSYMEARRWVQSQKLDHQDTKRTKVVTPSPKVKG